MATATNGTTCGCGGSHDGSANGLKKHNLTARHLGWVAGQQKEARVAKKNAPAPTTAADLRRQRYAEAHPDAAPLPEGDAVIPEASDNGETAPATEPKAKAAAKPAAKAKAPAKPAATLAAAKAEVAKFRQYVAYAAKESNHVKPENKAKYQAGLEAALARVAELTPAAPAPAISDKVGKIQPVGAKSPGTKSVAEAIGPITPAPKPSARAKTAKEKATSEPAAAAAE